MGVVAGVAGVAGVAAVAGIAGAEYLEQNYLVMNAEKYLRGNFPGGT